MIDLIHIGVPKTASTTLHEHVFQKKPPMANIGRPFANPDEAKSINWLALHDARDYYDSKNRRLAETHGLNPTAYGSPL